MITEEKEIIENAIKIASGYANGGVRTFVNPDGSLISNYVPYRLYFSKHSFTDEHKQLALKVWKEIYGA
jgi:hypothetical protein